MRMFITFFLENKTMSDYELKNYETGIEEAQAELGTEATKDWSFFGQSDAAALKNAYSREGFDPETRHYAFKDGKLVGFLVSRILPDTEDGIKRATFDFPFVKEGHEKAGELLYDRCISTLKDKGVTIADVRVLAGWKGTTEQAEKYGFKKGELQFVRIKGSLSNMQPKDHTEKFENFDPERDKEQIIKLFTENYNMTAEQAETNFNGIINPPEGQYFQPILREGDKIISRGLLYIPNEPKDATFRLLSPDPTKYFDAYLANIIPIAKEKGAENFELFLGGPTLEKVDMFKTYGFSVVDEAFTYKKEI